MLFRFFRPLPLLACFTLIGCGSEDPTTSPENLDHSLSTVITTQALDGDPADGQTAATPDSDPLLKLGQLLFFSKTLGGTFDSACASCHHPELAGGDMLSLPVGVDAVNPDYLGLGRMVDAAHDYDPRKDGGPNVPRNSQTILNVGLYKEFMFFDGRVSLLPSTGAGANIQTPESGLGPDPSAGVSLLTAQARFPVASGDEMRNFFHPELTDPEDYRQMLVARLKGQADQDKLSPQGPANWLARFRAAFNQPSGSADALVTYGNIQTAIAAYERSQVFTDSPWKRYVQGDSSAIDADSKRGALLFFSPKSAGGLGCASCHSGDFLTNERFYNVGFPQFGRGKRPDGRDFGRWQVTKLEADKFAFRVPSLLNIALTAPYGHTGAFQTLRDLLRYHANPVAGAASFDYSLSQLFQFSPLLGNTKTYDTAQSFTAEAINSPNLATSLLPGRDLSDAELTYLTAFLNSLTDTCLQDVSTCLAAWIPSPSDNPDGNQLIRSYSSAPPASTPPSSPPVSYPNSTVALATVATTTRTGFADLQGCSATPNEPLNNGSFFIERGVAAGLTVQHGYDQSLWLDNNVSNLQIVLMGGGITATYLNDDCLPDLIYTIGYNPGAVTYLNQGGGLFQLASLLGANTQGLYTSIGVGDLDGDFHRELILGNLFEGAVNVLKADAGGQYQLAASLGMSRNTYGIALGDGNADGYPDLYFGHWDYRTLPGTAPAFWRNNAGASLQAVDGLMGTSAAQSNPQIWQFAPAFVDIDQDGFNDLLIAADFGSTVVFHNIEKNGKRFFQDVTDRSVITDENAMGSTFGDYDNDGDLDWFVTSIYDPNGIAEGHWGVTGNRLYRNDSTPGDIRFADATETAGVRNGLWGWGTCFADFDNDGWLDLFQVDGYGYIPVSGRSQEEDNYLSFVRPLLTEFATQPSRLFMNNHNGSFTESAATWQIDLPMDGRGIVCTDLDRDGDVDVVVLDHSRRPKLFENRIGHGPGHRFVSIRLQGKSPNTDALGAKVYVSADLNGNSKIDPREQQLQVVQANTQFNSQTPLELHFGLGQAASINQVKIVWPDGQQQTFSGLAVNQFLSFTQP